jgi:peptidoglycan hydrolase-like protein with peptidoglycan-binding domain
MGDPLYEQVQRKLALNGFQPGPFDGLPGIRTRGAVKAYEKSVGLPADGEIDDRLLERLGIPKPIALIDPPHLAILRSKQGLREKEDYAALQAWLKSDKRTLGDPRKLPWCGDAIETCALNAGFGPVPSNPYLARNWLQYGVEAEPFFGGIGVFWRGKKSGQDGHVGLLVGISADGKMLRVKGGNQRNMICDVWIARNRLLGCRAPANWKGTRQPLPVLADNGEAVSTNEA